MLSIVLTYCMLQEMLVKLQSERKISNNYVLYYKRIVYCKIICYTWNIPNKIFDCIEYVSMYRHPPLKYNNVNTMYM